MDFSNVITNAGSDCFLHGTDSLGSFMDVYGARSRGPQKYSTDLQLFMITGIDYDNDESSAVTSSVTTATSSVPVGSYYYSNYSYYYSNYGQLSSSCNGYEYCSYNDYSRTDTSNYSNNNKLHNKHSQLS